MLSRCSRALRRAKTSMLIFLGSCSEFLSQISQIFTAPQHHQHHLVMASDEIVWQIINQQFCSFKLKLPGNDRHQKSTKQTFCRNEHNVTGLCNRQSCPLANSRYATIRADPSNQRLYLYIKTVERSHLPNKWWEKIRLSSNYTKALQQIDERLIYWPKFLIHKCKQRLTRLTQVRVRAQRLAKEEERLGERMVSRIAPKVRRREETRERKAEAAAKIERAIERELVERLRSGAYGDRPLNVEENVWKKVMRGLERSQEGVRDEDLDEGIEEEEREYEYEREPGQMEGDVEYVSDIEGDSEDDQDDMEDFDDWLGGQSADEEDGEEEDGSGEDEEDDDEGSEDEDQENAEALKKKLDGLKRKRPTAPASKPRKKASKGPKTNIEYEYEYEPPQRQMLLAK
jgi:protein MAK16